jgi:hypothetical protein
MTDLEREVEWAKNELEKFETTMARLLKLAEEKGLKDSSILDEVVHDVANSKAAGINNEGMYAQIRYIISQDGDHGVQELERIFNEGY